MSDADKLKPPMRRVAKASRDPETPRWICTLACGHVVYVKLANWTSPTRSEHAPRQAPCDDCVALTGVDVVAEAMRCQREVRAAADAIIAANITIRQAEKSKAKALHRLRYNVERMDTIDRDRYRASCERRRLRETPWES